MNIAQQIMTDPAASRWLKNALAGALNRDPVDACRDAELLLQILQERADKHVPENAR